MHGGHGGGPHGGFRGGLGGGHHGGFGGGPHGGFGGGPHGGFGFNGGYGGPHGGFGGGDNNMNYEDALAYFQQVANLPQDGLGIPDDTEDDDDGMLLDNHGSSGNTATQTRKPAGKTPVLDNFSTDLTKAALENKLDPVVGREHEMQRVM